MARIRTIKPSFWADPDVSRLPWDARLLLIGLISMSDDRGRFIATQSSICGYVFPHEEVTPTKFRRLMHAIEKSGVLQLYTVEGRTYGRFPKWASHQKISHPQASTIPVPEAEMFSE
jgi:DNA replication protein DnaT